ncbi:hypothetical protein NC651_008698 [Populus alba x Populus x berolinensis]|nr:hypothetical protein NC651_008698 [Populus alba x Populus x berolinensis]
MASSLTLKRLLFSPFLSPPVATSPSSRHFNTNALRDYDGDHESGRGIDDRPSRRSLARSRDDFLSDVFDPFSPTRSLSQVLNMMDQFMENPLVSAPVQVDSAVDGMRGRPKMLSISELICLVLARRMSRSQWSRTVW